jgi:ribosomal protein S18 acetylase RimI-like enzyme
MGQVRTPNRFNVPQIAVRAYRAADRTFVVELAEATLRELRRLEPRTRPPVLPGEGAMWFNEGRRDSWKEGSFIYVAEVNDDRAGFAIGGPASETRAPKYRPPMPERRIGGVHEIHVTKRHRRKGVGTALKRATERQLARRGYTEVVLSHLARNAPASRLYDSLGYRQGRVMRVKELRPRRN